MKTLLAAAGIAAAAFAMPAHAETIEKQIIAACARYAPLSTSQQTSCENILMRDNEQFVVQLATPAGQRIMADCEKMEVTEQLGRYVELRMCFRNGYKEELRAQAEEKLAQKQVWSIMLDIPQGSNARRLWAKKCIPGGLDQVANFKDALACLNENGAADTPPNGHIERLEQAMAPSASALDNFVKALKN